MIAFHELSKHEFTALDMALNPESHLYSAACLCKLAAGDPAQDSEL